MRRLETLLKHAKESFKNSSKSGSSEMIETTAEDFEQADAKIPRPGQRLPPLSDRGRHVTEHSDGNVLTKQPSITTWNAHAEQPSPLISQPSAPGSLLEEDHLGGSQDGEYMVEGLDPKQPSSSAGWPSLMASGPELTRASSLDKDYMNLVPQSPRSFSHVGGVQQAGTPPLSLSGMKSFKWLEGPAGISFPGGAAQEHDTSIPGGELDRPKAPITRAGDAPDGTEKGRRFIDRFDFMFEDYVGEDPDVPQERVTLPVVACFALNFSQKAGMALVMGYFSTQTRSPVQVILLISFQLMLLVYLVVVRPFHHGVLQWVEVLCHCFELLLFILAAALLGIEDNSPLTDGLNWGMIGCFLATITLLIAFEVRRMLGVLRSLWQQYKARRREPPQEEVSPSQPSRSNKSQKVFPALQ